MPIQLPYFWVDNFQGFSYNLTWQEKRQLVLNRVENAGFGWWIVLVAGAGFLTGAYGIFVINAVTPMLGTVYWQGPIPPEYQFAMNCATLVGSMFGQVIFGILADLHGRRHVYGLELVVTITASLGFATAASGVFNSLSILALLIFWRFLLGVGIGADYPLSAVITSEFAPTRYRGSMMAAVFFCQPLGQLIATLVAFAATTGFREHMLGVSNLRSCSVDATESVGLDCAKSVDRTWRLVVGLGTVPAVIAMVFRFTIPESVYYILDIKNDTNEAMQAREYFPSQEDLGWDDGEYNTQDDSPPNAVAAETNGEKHDQASSAVLSLPQDQDTHHDLELGPPAQNLPSNPIPQVEVQMVESSENPHQIKASRKDFYKFLFTDGNWTDLFATSMDWLLLDFAFYLLTVNTSKLVPGMFGQRGGEDQTPYQVLISNERHIMISTSIGAVLGGAIAIKVLNSFSRRKTQMWGFIVLAALLVVVGTLYVTLINSEARVTIIVLYALCQLFFNIGPNTTTFIIAAEPFPTRYRCTCHGIAAASGKLGSVLAQCVVHYVTEVGDERRVGWVLISLVVLMLAGAALTKYVTPETCDIRGKSRKLTDLALGKAHRKELESMEREPEGQRHRE